MRPYWTSTSAWPPPPPLPPPSSSEWAQPTPSPPPHLTPPMAHQGVGQQLLTPSCQRGVTAQGEGIQPTLTWPTRLKRGVVTLAMRGTHSTHQGRPVRSWGEVREEGPLGSRPPKLPLCTSAMHPGLQLPQTRTPPPTLLPGQPPRSPWTFRSLTQALGRTRCVIWPTSCLHPAAPAAPAPAALQPPARPPRCWSPCGASWSWMRPEPRTWRVCCAMWPPVHGQPRGAVALKGWPPAWRWPDLMTSAPWPVAAAASRLTCAGGMAPWLSSEQQRTGGPAPPAAPPLAPPCLQG
ncbi:hypothetical protein V8C86DRAFT_2836968 [Haematococcus lacustris]